MFTCANRKEIADKHTDVAAQTSSPARQGLIQHLPAGTSLQPTLQSIASELS